MKKFFKKNFSYIAVAALALPMALVLPFFVPLTGNVAANVYGPGGGKAVLVLPQQPATGDDATDDATDETTYVDVDMPTDAPSIDLDALPAPIEDEIIPVALELTNEVITIAGGVITIGDLETIVSVEDFGAPRVTAAGATVLPVRLTMATLFDVDPMDDDVFVWNPNTATVVIDPNGRNIVLTVGNGTMTVGGETIAIMSGDGDEAFPYAPFIDLETDRMFIPLRAVAEAVGFDVSWDADTATVTLAPPSS